MVQRYNSALPVWKMTEEENGSWCKYSDVESLQSKLDKAVELLTPFAHCKCDCGECHNCLADKFISDIKALQSGADARGEERK